MKERVAAGSTIFEQTTSEPVIGTTWPAYCVEVILPELGAQKGFKHHLHPIVSLLFSFKAFLLLFSFLA